MEKYAVDYTRGFLPPVTALLSLLGLLGYLSALLKLSFGVKVHEGNGFSITALRSYAWVRSRDEDVRGATEVHYLERMILDSSVQWEVAKSMSNTSESMPLIAGNGVKALRDRRSYNAAYTVAICTMAKFKGTATMAFGLCAICLALSASIASFATLSCTSGWAWPRFFACAGRPVSVLMGGLPWCLIHIIERLPLKASELFRSDWRDDSVRGTRCPDTEKPLLKRENTLAYFTREDYFHIFDCRGVSQPHMLMSKSSAVAL